MTGQVWIDGQPGNSLPTSDRGLLYGDGVFETIRLQQGQPLLWSEHQQRLLRSCHQFGIDIDAASVEQQLETALAAIHEPELNASVILKIIVTRGDGGRGYMPTEDIKSRIIIQLHPLPSQLSDHAVNGVGCVVCTHPVSTNPALAGHKHLNRLDQVLASRELAGSLKALNVFEGLMTDGQGLLIEGTRCNVFVVVSGQLCTPDLSTAGVAGVMRGWLIAQFEKHNIAVHIRGVSLEELKIASELFICNSVLGVIPVTRVHAGSLTTEPPVSYQRQHYARMAQTWLREKLGI